VADEVGKTDSYYRLMVINLSMRDHMESIEMLWINLFRSLDSNVDWSKVDTHHHEVRPALATTVSIAILTFFGRWC
jgi:hypothetical protein